MPAALKLVADTAPATAMPVRKANSTYRTREHLTGDEIEQIIAAAKTNRWGSARQHDDPRGLPSRLARLRTG